MSTCLPATSRVTVKVPLTVFLSALVPKLPNISVVSLTICPKVPWLLMCNLTEGVICQKCKFHVIAEKPELYSLLRESRNLWREVDSILGLMF